jgi:hypothetical protein
MNQRMRWILVVGTAAGANAAALWAGGGWPGSLGDGIFDIVVIGWLSVPIGVLIMLVDVKQIGVMTLAIVAPLVEVAVAWLAYQGLQDTSSSTGALAVIWGPIWGVIAVLAVWGAGRGAHRLRSRRA